MAHGTPGPDGTPERNERAAAGGPRDGDGAVGPTVRGPGGEDLLVSARLGWLYLEQDHLRDAESVFRAVLDWRPEDEDARDGLEVTVRRLERRRRVLARLKGYLARLRRHAGAKDGSGAGC